MCTCHILKEQTDCRGARRAHPRVPQSYRYRSNRVQPFRPNFENYVTLQSINPPRNMFYRHRHRTGDIELLRETLAPR